MCLPSFSQAARINGQPAVLALSSRPWLGYNDMGRYTLAPLSFGALDHAAAFSSESCPEGFVAVSEDKLRVLMMERLSGAFNQQVVPLRYTPRHAIVHPSTKLLIVCESDKQAVPLEERTDLVPPDAMEGVEVKPMVRHERRSRAAALALAGAAAAVAHRQGLGRGCRNSQETSLGFAGGLCIAIDRPRPLALCAACPAPALPKQRRLSVAAGTRGERGGASTRGAIRCS